MNTPETTPQNFNGRTYWIIAAVLLAAIIAVSSWKLWGFLYPPRTETAAADPNCNLQADACNVTFSDGTEVSLAVQPTPIPLLKPITLQSTVKGANAKRVEVDIVGVDMNMGYIRPELSSAGVSGLFEGESILPVCILNEMEWEARVMVHSDAGLLVAPFRFTTRKNQ